ncbi:MAG: DUF86 domain-containing protein [Candidatus Gottesmanbacteria bacterium]|nr:DUF86 domain-containing protein [Candidatus Gottesmanbacteria bacterium]
MSEHNTLLYLSDIREAIEKINEFVSSMSFEAFSRDARTIDAVVRNIEVIGEAARHIPEPLRLAYPTVPWKQVVGARDKVVHEYFGIDLEVIWKTIQDDLPVLKREIDLMIKAQQK